MYDKKVSGGAILHANMDKPFRSVEKSWNMVNFVAHVGMVYFPFNNKISLCEEGHSFYGEKRATCGKFKVGRIHKNSRISCLCEIVPQDRIKRRISKKGFY